MSRVSFRLSIHLESPALLAAGPPAGNLVEGLDCIPGNTVRGVLAATYLRQNGHEPEDKAFQRLFLRGEAHFGFAYKEGAWPFPLSARTCKYEDGFVRDGEHVVVDWLLADLLQNLDTEPPAADRSCTVCDHPLDYAEGYYQPDGEGPHEVHVRRRTITRTAIDPARATARSGQLYSYRVLEEGQRFLGTVEVPSDLENTFNGLVSSDGLSARIGTARSRGQGWCTIRCERSEAGGNTDLAVAYNEYRNSLGKPVLAVTLLSDTVLRDDYLRYRGQLRPADLSHLGIVPDDWQETPSVAYCATRTVFGFDGAPLRLPREPRLAIQRGSCFAFLAKGGNTPTIPANLARRVWLGDHNDEGYGEALLWHPFHLQPDQEIACV